LRGSLVDQLQGKDSSSDFRRFPHGPGQAECNCAGQQQELERLREEVKRRNERIAELEKAGTGSAETDWRQRSAKGNWH